MKLISQKIISIGNDRINGSSDICIKLAKAMKDEIVKFDNEKKVQLFLGRVEKYIISSHPDMFILFAFFKKLKLTKNLLKCIDEFIETLKNAPKIIASKLQSKFNKIKKVMTYSGSSIVEATLKELKKQNCSFEVIVCESRPLYEGKKLAIKLANAKIPTTLVTDATAFSFINSVDALITGADMIGKNLFVNKVGTKALFELGSLHELARYVLCEKYKMTNVNIKSNPLKYGLEQEICKKKTRFFKIFNPYFENVPISLTTEIITN